MIPLPNLTTSPNSASPPQTQDDNIFAHQRAAFDHLTAVAKACFCTQRQTLPIRLRTNTLLVGPSGGGKTHLARCVAENMGAAFLPLTAGAWMILGASGKGGGLTWPLIVRFLESHHKAEGIVIFLDEIDKLTPHLGAGTSSWDNSVKMELFSMLDLTIPVGMTDDEGVSINSQTILRAQTVLREKTFIVGAGAFQHLWEPQRQTMGFLTTTSDSNKEIGLNLLARNLPRELTNRFRSHLVVLPQLVEADYFHMLDSVSKTVPHYLRDTFLRLGNEHLPAALACQQGCRFLEDLLLETIIYERSVMADPKVEVFTTNSLPPGMLEAGMI